MSPAEMQQIGEAAVIVGKVLAVLVFVFSFLASFLGKLAGQGVVLFLLRCSPAFRRFDRADRIRMRRLYRCAP